MLPSEEDAETLLDMAIKALDGWYESINEAETPASTPPSLKKTKSHTPLSRIDARARASIPGIFLGVVDCVISVQFPYKSLA